MTLARASLPSDHPLCSTGPGRYGREVHAKAAAAAERKMRAHGVPIPSEEELQRLANGGVDLEAVRAHRKLAAEAWAMREALTHASSLNLADLTALVDALRPAVEKMKAALAAKER